MYPKRTFGAVGKVGIVGGTPAISDFHRWLHPEIAISSAPLPLADLSPAGLSAMTDEIKGLYRHFCRFDPVELAFFSCTSGSLVGGMGYDQELCALIQAESGAKDGYTTSTAVVEALRRLGSKKISICTPYPDDVNAIEYHFFQDQGYVVNNIDGIKTADPRNRQLIPKLEPELIYDFAVEHMHPQSDTMFLSCTAMMVLEIIGDLEKRLSVPVITSNQCALWKIGSWFGQHRQEAVQQLGTLLTLS